MRRVEEQQEPANSSGSGEAPEPRGDRIFAGIAAAFGLTVAIVPLLMIVGLARASQVSFATLGLSFLTSSVWAPSSGRFGVASLLAGTVVSSLLALAVAVPISFGLAIFLSDLAPHRLRKPLGSVVEMLAAIPPVVYGLWGMLVLAPWLDVHVAPHLAGVPLLSGRAHGAPVIAAGAILAVMVVPTITAISREVLEAVPASHRESAVGLGATPWGAIRHVVLPAARAGLVGAVLLGLNRALGEAIAVAMIATFTAGASGAPSAASAIALEFPSASSSLHLSALSHLALVLLALTLITSALSRALVASTRRRFAIAPHDAAEAA